MGILVNKKSRILTQGISGKSGRFHTQEGILYGSNFVGGVTPGKGGMEVVGVPVFDTLYEAQKELSPLDVSLIFVPASQAANAIFEAEDAGIPLIICITEGIPNKDMIEVCRTMRLSKRSRLIGPNCPGAITPEECKVGIMPGYIHKKGRVGIVSRSGTLTYEGVWQTTLLGLGQSSCVGIGGDPLNGTHFIDILEMFEQDAETEGILMIGEIGGYAEEEAAEWIQKYGQKPIAAFIAGITAPPGKRMGHAGAIISSGRGGARDKMEVLKKAGVRIVENPALMGVTMSELLRSQ